MGIYLWEYPESAYKKYAPDEYRKVNRIMLAGVLGFITGLICFYMLIPIFGEMLTIGSFLLLTYLVYVEVLALNSKVHAAILADQEQLVNRVAEVQNDFKKFSIRVGELKAEGHVVMAGEGAVVIIDSTVTNSFNAIKRDDPVLADALQTVTGAIEKSGNKDAGQAWARFMKELSGEQDKSVLSSLWDRVVKLVPDIASLVESAAKIMTLFA